MRHPKVWVALAARSVICTYRVLTGFLKHPQNGCRTALCVSKSLSPVSMGQMSLLILDKPSSELDKHLSHLPKNASVLAIGKDEASVSGRVSCDGLMVAAVRQESAAVASAMETYCRALRGAAEVCERCSDSGWGPCSTAIAGKSPLSPKVLCLMGSRLHQLQSSSTSTGAEVSFICDMQKLFPRLTGLQWVHSTSAGLDKLLFPDLVNSSVVLTNAKVPGAAHTLTRCIAGQLSTARQTAGLQCCRITTFFQHKASDVVSYTCLRCTIYKVL